MKSFKDFSPTSSGQGKGNTDTVGESDAAELTKKIAAAYNGKSSGEMLRNILKEAEEKKRAGKLSNGEIDEFYAQFAPLLNGGQRKKLEQVISRLKNI